MTDQVGGTETRVSQRVSRKVKYSVGVVALTTILMALVEWGVAKAGGSIDGSVRVALDVLLFPLAAWMGGYLPEEWADLFGVEEGP